MSESYTFTVNGVSRTTHKEEPLLRQFYHTEGANRNG